VITAGRSSADISCDPLNLAQLEQLFSEQQPTIVINAIAYTAVDKAESEPEQAMALNAQLPGCLSDLCAEHKALLIHYSTDFVFDGTNNSPYEEQQSTNPISVYGKSKLAGEKAIQMSACAHVILRTSWVYSEHGNNFMKTMLRLAGERKELGVVDDQVGSPTYSLDIAKASVAIAQRYLADPKAFNNLSGIYHLTNQGQISWHGFAKSIFEMADAYCELAIETLNPISTEQYPTPAQRPAYSVMSNEKLKQTFDIELPDWRDALSLCLATYFASH
jgi:dTDP-4-dehydrorhamnose reductase